MVTNTKQLIEDHEFRKILRRIEFARKMGDDKVLLTDRDAIIAEKLGVKVIYENYNRFIKV